MSRQPHHAAAGLHDTRYRAFLESIEQLRPALHRYCARMVGSVLDGEDVVQEALFEAYRSLDTFDASRRLAPWLFRIAHNRAIDYVRRHEARRGAEQAAVGPAWIEPVEPSDPGLGRALERLVYALPPKERACVLLKDVFDYTLEETASLVDSTVGGVKSALHRGRAKLAALSGTAIPVRQSPEEPSAQLVSLYVERFNRRDWEGVRELIAADARVDVADRFAGSVADAPYFGRYARLTSPWHVGAGSVDGQRVVVVHRSEADASRPFALVRLTVRANRITRIADYTHCGWVLAAAAAVLVEARPERVPSRILGGAHHVFPCAG